MKFSIIYLLITFVLVSYCSAQENKVDATKQTAKALRQKYGNPISETFLIRPNIVVAVSYDKAGQISQMVIEPKLDDAFIKSRSGRIDDKTLKEVIDELVPDKVKGKGLYGSFINATCPPENDCAGTMSGYENVTIYYNGSIDSHRYSTIQWHKNKINTEK